MFDKDLMAMLGKDKTHLVFVVLLETVEECLSLAFSAFLCPALKDALEGSQDVSRYALFLGLEKRKMDISLKQFKLSLIKCKIRRVCKFWKFRLFFIRRFQNESSCHPSKSSALDMLSKVRFTHRDP